MSESDYVNHLNIFFVGCCNFFIRGLSKYLKLALICLF